MIPLERLGAALADRYRPERELGQGGMATVYLAQDLRHDRSVAIKVLRPELAAVIGAERFLREIKTIAHLQHPHILGLIDSGEANGTAYYVMPYVEGESLRDRLTRETQLPISVALRIATEVASALDYAHRHGVIHRDIKPENVLLHDGSALVADFGIALAVSSAGGTRMTETGMSLGTPHYMSPEQAMGEREITARSDVYALGAMTYEMLAGEPPFTGPTAQAIVAKVMTEKPVRLSIRRETVPPSVENAVLTALAKLPADRFETAAEFAAALEAPRTTTTVAPAGLPARRDSALLRGLGAVAVVATLAALFLGWKLSQQRPAPITRLSLDLPDLRVNHLGYYGGAFALAADGSRLVYLAQPPGAPTRLMVRERGDLTPRLLEGTEGADGPFFSPDGRWVGYSVAGKLYKVPVSGGAPVLLGNVAMNSIASGAWLEDGRILFSNESGDLLSIPANGGATTTILKSPGSFGFTLPVALPRQDAILAALCSINCTQMALMAVNLETLAFDTILPNTAVARYLPTGHLVAVQQDGTVLGGRFDLSRLRFRGAPATLFTGVQVELGIMPDFTLANDGTLIYLASNQTGTSALLARVDRTGQPRLLAPSWLGRFSSMALSPDGKRVALSILDQSLNHVWMKQLDDGPLTQLTFDGTINYRPAWLPDGRTVSFTSDAREGRSYLYRMRADGSDKPQRIFPDDTTQIDEALWSRDGKWIVYRSGVTGGFRDIYARRTEGDTTRITVSAGAPDEYMPTVSPDGRWIAYVSVESGREEVYVRPFPETGRARWQISAAGGANPLWSNSGRELFYVDLNDSLVAVNVSGTPDFQPGSRKTLFSARPFVLLPLHRSYDVAPDDQSFVMLKRALAGSAEANRLTVVLNWFPEVEAKVRQGR